MDNLTHGLLGAAIGMLRRRDGGPERDRPLSDTDRAVPWATFLAAEAPDIDVLIPRSGPLDGFVHHRGITHSIPGALALATAVALLTRLVWRRARLGTVWGWSVAAVLIGHLVNDWMTGWGTRLLLPWSQTRYALDWVPIVDPFLYTLPLLAACLWGWRRPAARRRAAALALGWLALYTSGRGISQWLVARSLDRALGGRPVAQRRVYPDLVRPWVWHWVVDLGDRYTVGTANPLGHLQLGGEVAKPPDDPVTRAVRQAPALAPFFAQFQFPLMAYQRDGDGYRVELWDVRYPMRYRVRLGPDLAVREVASGGWR